MPTASAVEVYKTIGDVELKAWIFSPIEHNTGDAKPAIVFFFGGGWRAGNPAQFQKHCEYLAARGMVAMAVDYRVSSRHGVTANQCVADAKSAIRWMRSNADRLGIDRQKIVAAGGSAGGHLAASTATLSGHDDPRDDLTVSATPNALALFNPAVVLASIPDERELGATIVKMLSERMGAEPESMSPYHHIAPGIGPTIIFHGTADKTVEYRTVELFQKKMAATGNQCTLVGYEGETHGFFNYLKKNNGPFISTMQKLDAFLVSNGYLDPLPVITGN
ncbi:MAG: alpha/beta hydrolase [Cyclobacteriaceae bacterium]